MKCHSSYTITLSLQVFNVYNLVRNVYAFKVSVCDLPPCLKAKHISSGLLVLRVVGIFYILKPEGLWGESHVIIYIVRFSNATC